MSVALRIQNHQAGANLMLAGDHKQALAVLQSTLLQYGPHVGLLSDLVAVLYLLGRMQDCNIMMARLESELLKAHPRLSLESHAKTELFLGKVYEEQGFVARAQSHYSEAARLANLHIEVRVRAQVQLLRLNSFLGVRKGLQYFYQACLRLKTESLNLDIELEHGLMLAEFALFGPDLAEARLMSLLEAHSLSATDRLLLIIDFAEEALRQKISPERVQKYLDYLDLDQASDFERMIVTMISEESFSLEAHRLNDFSKKLPVLGFLRILTLGMDRAHSDDLKDAYRKMFIFILEGLDSDSKTLLLKKWQSHIKISKAILTYEPAAGMLFFNGSSIQIRSQSFADKCLACFEQRSSLTIEDFVEAVFGTEMDTVSYDRVRMALNRLNKDLSTLTGQPKVFLARKAQIDLQAGLQIVLRRGR